MTWLFSCPGCTQTIDVNEPMRSAILERGCPVCGDPVEQSSFEPDGDAEIGSDPANANDA